MADAINVRPPAVRIGPPRFRIPPMSFPAPQISVVLSLPPEVSHLLRLRWTITFAPSIPRRGRNSGKDGFQRAARPMTYLAGQDGKQFVVIAAGGHGKLGTNLADSLSAYSPP